MAFKFFTIPVSDAAVAEAELNGFVRQHKVLSVDRRWVEQGPSSFWAFCLDFLDAPSKEAISAGAGDRRTRVDYKELLKPEEFALFAKLRDLRKEIAQTEAVPIYTIFTNEQLARMVQTKARTKSALEQIAGVGDARIEKYGTRVLEFLEQQWTTPEGEVSPNP